MTTVHYQIIKRDCFSLLKFLHLNDNSKYVKKGQPGHNPLSKVRRFLDPLIKNFQEDYHPSCKLSIDESMIGFKGRLSFFQYLPKKPTKWGMKAFVLADSRNRYTYNWRLYTGKHKWVHCTIMHNSICDRFSKSVWVSYSIQVLRIPRVKL